MARTLVSFVRSKNVPFPVDLHYAETIMLLDIVLAKYKGPGTAPHPIEQQTQYAGFVEEHAT